jgi:hypothetical protein
MPSGWSASTFRSRITLPQIASPQVGESLWIVQARQASHNVGLYPATGFHIASSGKIILTEVNVGGYRPKKGELFSIVSGGAQVLADGSKAPEMQAVTACVANCGANNPTLESTCQARPSGGSTWDDCQVHITLSGGYSFGSRGTAASGCSTSSFTANPTYGFSPTSFQWYPGPLAGGHCHISAPKEFYYRDAVSGATEYVGLVKSQADASSTITTTYRFGR